MAQQKTDATADKLSADVKALREQIEKLSEGQREIPLLRAEVIGQDKRLSDTVSRIGDVNIWLAGFAILVTMLISGAGFLGLVQAGRKATKEAREWIRQNEQNLRDKIAAFEAQAAGLRAQGALLERQADDIKTRMEEHAQSIAEQAAQHEAGMNHKVEEFSQSLKDIQARAIGEGKSLNPEEKRELRQAANQAKDKPESQYTAQDWSLRAHDAYASGELEKAALYWGNISQTVGATDLQIAQALFNKGVVLGQLRRWGEENATYDEVDGRFGTDTHPDLRLSVGKALVNKGVTLGQLGRLEDAVVTHGEVDRRFGLDSQPELQELVLLALVNKGRVLGRLQRFEDALAAYGEVERRFGTDPRQEMRAQVATALGNRGWLKYQIGDDAAFLTDTQQALERSSTADWLLGNQAFAFYLNGRSREVVLVAYEQAWQVVNDPAKWEELALTDLRAHGRTVRTESPPVPDDLIEAVAALAKGAE